tara:strand:+ start:265 stop:1242 length:978 start_codon:yes stop_codon:yes gene_type:complete
MKIAIDVMGGDNSPISNIKGVFSYLSKYNDDKNKFILVGNSSVIKNILFNKFEQVSNVEIVNATQTISSKDTLSKIHKIKPDCPIVKCISMLRDNDVDAVISAGNTGALLSSSLFLLNKIKHIKRPALVPYIPSDKGDILLCDAGANIHTKPLHMLQYAIMASEYYKLINEKTNPRIGLINIGTEKNKGTELYKESYQLLNETMDGFVGFIESRDLLNGKVDIVISDGFTGNIMLKLIEGMFANFYELLKNNNLDCNNFFNEELLYENHGGAPFLGVEGIVVKCHGSSSYISIENSILQVIRLYDTELIKKISIQTANSINTIVE